MHRTRLKRRCSRPKPTSPSGVAAPEAVAKESPAPKVVAAPKVARRKPATSEPVATETAPTLRPEEHYNVEGLGLPSDALPTKIGRGKHSYTVDKNGLKIDVLIRAKAFFVKECPPSMESAPRTYTWKRYGGTKPAWEELLKMFSA